MIKSTAIYSASCLATLSLLTSSTNSFAQANSLNTKPNIIFILADDLGYMDVAYNNPSFYETPNINQLAADGLIFTNAYSCGPNCAPTRASLISGTYTPRHHIYTPGARSKGRLDYMRLAVPNRESNNPLYNTIPTPTALPENTPSIATNLKAAGYTTARFGKWHLGPHHLGFDISSTSDKPNDTKTHYNDINIAETLTSRAITFIDNHKDKPFFLYLSHFDVHTPIKARADITDYFKQKLEKTDEKYNPIYAAMIHAVDHSVGRIRDHLKKIHLDQNTIIIFSSDNGGVTSVTTNKPLRSGKGSLFEGGIRIPTIILYPHVTAPNTRCDTPINSVDFLPTFAEIAQSPIPSDQLCDGISILPLLKSEHINPRPIFWYYPLYLSGNKKVRNIPVHNTDHIYWRGVPAAAIRFGDYKLIRYFENNSTKLFNLKNDISETTDLSTLNPQMHQELLTMLNNWLADTNAHIPTKLNPTFTLNNKTKATN
ncbi:sulfatase [Poriferisphaera sp. WC338]|uniref:sulfatase n=1 Tax=Poriferisphaera sp. WC338 TaxID=3425129 RepID=UPI003D813ED3